MLPNPTKLFHLQKLNSFVRDGWSSKNRQLAATGAPSNVGMVIIHGDSVSLQGPMPRCIAQVTALGDVSSVAAAHHVCGQRINLYAAAWNPN